MRTALILLVSLFLSLREVTPVQGVVTNRILFVVDVSGSMRTGPYLDEALASLRTIADVPTDDLQIAVLAFNKDLYRWAGKPGPGIQDGWASLPDSEALSAVSAWLSGMGTGDTVVAPALSAAFREDMRNLTIVLLTDGRFNGPMDANALALVRNYQRVRETCAYGRAVFIVIGYANPPASLQELAESGYYIYEP